MNSPALRPGCFLLCWAWLALLAGPAAAQGKKPEDKSKRPSPPATVAATVGGVPLTIEYSRPSVKGRTVFGKLVPYGQVWRTGANEATTIRLEQDALVNGQPLHAGQYALFTVPGPDEWTVIFNREFKQWGAYEYKAAEDALRIRVKPTQLAQPVEQFTISADAAGPVRLAWENTQAEFTVAKAAK